MNRNSVRLVNVRGSRYALSNIACGNGVDNFATVVDLLDAIEDSYGGEEMLSKVSKLQLLGFYNIQLDRETNEYVRLKGNDSLGNKFYLIAEF